MSFIASIDLHLSDKETITNYLNLLGKYQIKSIMTSLIGLNKEDWEKLVTLTNLAKKYQIEVYGAINGELLKELNLLAKKTKELINFFKTKGLSGVRIVDNIDLAWQAKLTHNSSQFKVILNGSYNIIQLEQLILGHRINSNNAISCYNSYPQRYTGASVDFYLINQYESHINNMLFAGCVSLSDDAKPSLELHRDWELVTQIYHLIALGTDFILITSHLTEKDLIGLKNIDWEKVSLKIDFASDISEQEKQILFDDKNHFVRPDLAQDVIRSTISKVIKKDLSIDVREIAVDFFDVGDVVILNQEAKSSIGELQIVTKKIKNDGIRNLVARVKEPYLSYFLSELKATRAFKFII